MFVAWMTIILNGTTSYLDSTLISQLIRCVYNSFMTVPSPTIFRESSGEKNRCSLGFHASFHETKKWAGTEAVEVCVIRRVVEQVQGCVWLGRYRVVTR